MDNVCITDEFCETKIERTVPVEFEKRVSEITPDESLSLSTLTPQPRVYQSGSVRISIH